MPRRVSIPVYTSVSCSDWPGSEYNGLRSSSSGGSPLSHFQDLHLPGGALGPLSPPAGRLLHLDATLALAGGQWRFALVVTQAEGPIP
jgi:hypothetical protein